MRAIVCEKFGPLEELVWKELPDPSPGPGQVAVKIHAAGLNFADALLVQGLYQARPPFPFVPGAEFAGEVLSVGEGVDGFAAGDRVMAYSTTMGAFAEAGVFRANDLMLAPNGIEFDEGAALLCAHGTAHHALKQRAGLRSGETLLVLGAAGGTGSAAVQIGKAMGATVLAAASSPEKLDLARENGADLLIDYAREELKTTVKELTGGRGVDVVYDPVGGDAFDASTRCVARNGRLLVIGFASGRIPSAPANLALLKNCSIVGVFWGAWNERDPAGNVRNFELLFRWWREGKLKPHVSHRFPLARTVDALNAVAARKVTGKAVIEVA
jgi:NADPH2:quinone reductase